MTATPATNSNVLVRVTAQELYNEEMIKLPVRVGEVSNSPEKTIDLAVQKRAELEKIAVAESEYIRPIALYQAENKNREFNVDFVKKYLIGGAKVPSEEIAIATGERHELDEVNLFSKGCKFRHIITVQALKEGWDCPFAAVFCSLTNTHSPKDAEQLLGRVLRMPNAKRKNFSELNQAYAFFRVGSWLEAVNKIKDDLLAMRFDEKEVKFAIGEQPKLFEQKITVEIITSAPPEINYLNMILQTQITTEKIDGGYKTTLKDISEEDSKELLDNKNKIFKNVDDRNKFLAALNQPQIFKRKSPAEKGVVFAIPQLCLDFGDGAEIAEREDFFPDGWSLTETKDYSLPLERDDSDIKFYEFTLNGNKLKSRMLFDDSANLFTGQTNWTQTELISWLAGKISNDFITPEDFAEFTRRALNMLINEKNFTLAELVRMRFSIKKLIEEKIESCIDKTCKQNFQTVLFKDDSPKVYVGKNIALTFNQNYYPAKNFYSGAVEFNKHFYLQIGDMNVEEIFCAQCIDANKNIETWIRNIEKEEKYSFWLPTHKGKFYPDFVVKLKNGTYAAIEYKGGWISDTSDTQEKKSVGEVWANKSNGFCKFLLVTAKNNRGRDVSTQINDFLH